MIGVISDSMLKGVKMILILNVLLLVIFLLGTLLIYLSAFPPDLPEVQAGLVFVLVVLWMALSGLGFWCGWSLADNVIYEEEEIFDRRPIEEVI